MPTIQPKIQEIPGTKCNGKKTSGKKFFENLGIPREVDLFLEILENAVPFATGSCRKKQSRHFGWMESFQWINKQTVFKQIPKHYDNLPL